MIGFDYRFPVTIPALEIVTGKSFNTSMLRRMVTIPVLESCQALSLCFCGFLAEKSHWVTIMRVYVSFYSSSTYFQGLFSKNSKNNVRV